MEAQAGRPLGETVPNFVEQIGLSEGTEHFCSLFGGLTSAIALHFEQGTLKRERDRRHTGITKLHLGHRWNSQKRVHLTEDQLLCSLVLLMLRRQTLSSLIGSNCLPMTSQCQCHLVNQHTGSSMLAWSVCEWFFCIYRNSMVNWKTDDAAPLEFLVSLLILPLCFPSCRQTKMLQMTVWS